MQVLDMNVIGILCSSTECISRRDKSLETFEKLCAARKKVSTVLDGIL